jgi:hypothetical protein
MGSGLLSVVRGQLHKAATGGREIVAFGWIKKIAIQV